MFLPLARRSHRSIVGAARSPPLFDMGESMNTSTEPETTETPSRPKAAPKRGKRGQNEGGIYQRASDSSWVASLNIGYVDGKRKRALFYGKTRAKVAAKLRKAQDNLDKGVALTDVRLTMVVFLEQWLTDKVKPSIAPRPIAATRHGRQVHRASDRVYPTRQAERCGRATDGCSLAR